MIRVFNLTTNAMVHEFCRGRNPAVVNSISASDAFISCTSNHGTTHFFRAFASQTGQSQV
jgi:hypothetical protein